MKKKNEVQDKVASTFASAFGRTPLVQRIADIFGEAIELSRYTDDQNLDEELGDLLSSAIALAAERGKDYRQLVQNTLNKIERRKKQYRSLGRKTKVAILGGAFDPITNGHINLCKFVLDTSRTFDEVWIMPCYGHMYGKNTQSPEHRLAMCELAAKVDRRIKVFPYEIENKLKGETYQTVKLLQEEDFAKDNFDFSWIIGQDNANTFDKWVNYELLEKMIRFVVVPRCGVKPDPKVKWYYKEPHIYLTDENAIGDVSSTMVRSLLRPNAATQEDHNTSIWLTGKDNIEDALISLIGTDVYNYIKKHKLYGYGV